MTDIDRDEKFKQDYADDVRARLEAANAPDDLLDELVHETASQTASDVNNGGLDAQLSYLIDEIGTDGVRAFLKTIGIDLLTKVTPPMSDSLDPRDGEDSDD